MAVKRRSARLQKASPSPGPNESAADASTAPSKSLPTVSEHEDTSEKLSKTPEKTTSHLPRLATTPKASAPAPKPALVTPKVQVPTTKTMATPISTMKSLFSRAGFMHRTPQNKMTIQPSEEEMHPQLHHQTTAKPREEARWLGLFGKGSQTVHVVGSHKIAAAQGTPTKATGSVSKNVLSPPNFKFNKPKQPSLELSPEAKRLMEETREEAAKVRAQWAASGEEAKIADEINTAIGGALTGRKFAQPKGKAGRYSDVHMEAFKKMDSIANHPSAFRADPARYKPEETTQKSLKRSPSKAELDNEDIPSMTSRRAPAKSGIPSIGGASAKARATIKLVPPEKRQSLGAGPSKRVKNTATQDASSNRDKPLPATPKTLPPTKIGTSRLAALATPTKSSIARAQTAKPMKSGLPSLTGTPSKSNIPSFMRTPSNRSIITSRATTSIREGVRQISDSLKQKSGIKGILRTPQRQFSNDPVKLAAGTHVATPEPSEVYFPSLPASPTAKRVEFTASTVARADKAESKTPQSESDDDAVQASKTPQSESDDDAVQASNAEASNNVEYPSIDIVQYPSIDSRVLQPLPLDASRRSTISDLPIPGSFDFRSERQVSFGPATTGTIRAVRKSDASEMVQAAGAKRKLDIVEEVVESNKENTEPADDIEEGRSVKRSRPSVVSTPAAAPKTPSRLGRNSTARNSMVRTSAARNSAARKSNITPSRLGGLTPSRLNFLSMPKRRG